MKGLALDKPGAIPEVRTDLETPEPGEGQILVRSLYTAVNPVDAFMADFGILVNDWPLVPGCDAGGVVIKVGNNPVNALGQTFKEGDEVFGCTRLGTKGYSPWQEYYLMDSHVTIPKPSNITLAQASTVGVGILTASLGVFGGLSISKLNPDNLPPPREEWALVFGGASTVGKFAVQLLKLCGFKVVTTCSESSFNLLKSLGADASISYKKSEDDITSELKNLTGGNLYIAFDAVSVNNTLITHIFGTFRSNNPGTRIYTTTNDWDPLPDESHGFVSKPILLGPIGRPEAKELNEEIAEFIPVIVKLIENERIKVGEYILGGEGIEGLNGAWDMLKSGKAGNKKVVVKITDD